MITNLVDPRTGKAGPLTLSSIVVSNSLGGGSVATSQSSTSASSSQGSTTTTQSSQQSRTSAATTTSASETESVPSGSSTTIPQMESSPSKAYWIKPMKTGTAIGVIIGATIGGLAVIFGCLSLFWWFGTRRRNAYNQLNLDQAGGFEKRKLVLDPENPVITNSQTGSRGEYLTNTPSRNSIIYYALSLGNSLLFRYKYSGYNPARSLINNVFTTTSSSTTQYEIIPFSLSVELPGITRSFYNLFTMCPNPDDEFLASVGSNSSSPQQPRIGW